VPTPAEFLVPRMELGGLEPPTSWVRSDRALDSSSGGFRAIRAAPPEVLSAKTEAEFLRPRRPSEGYSAASLVRKPTFR
jgi:hypothetical protein